MFGIMLNADSLAGVLRNAKEPLLNPLATSPAAMFPTVPGASKLLATFTNNSEAGIENGMLFSGELLTSKYFNDDGNNGDNQELNSGHRANDIEMRLLGTKNGV